MIAVYQNIVLDSDGFVGNQDALTAKSNMMMGANKWKDEYIKYYTHVFEVNTDNLDQAFESTNLWNDDKVCRISKGYSSSVGDIFVKDGNCYIVDIFGFTKIGKYDMEFA